MMDQIQPVEPTPRINPGRLLHWSFFICYLLSAMCYSRILAAGTDTTGTGEKIFQTRCFVCHGRDGRGSGPASPGLSQKPQDLTDPSWQRSVTDDQIKTVIREGGAILGKSGAMPPNADLSDDTIEQLVSYVRTLNRERH